MSYLQCGNILVVTIFAILTLLLYFVKPITSSSISKHHLRAIDVSSHASVFPLPNLRILPLGDSITYGYLSTTGDGYRAHLLGMLNVTFPSITYIGSQHSGNLKNNANEGHPGYMIHDIAKKAVPSLVQEPNLILLMAGTNDIARPYMPEDAPWRLGALIDFILLNCPFSTLIVAQLAPITKPPESEKMVKNFNAQVPKIVALRQGAGKKVLAVDMSQKLTAANLHDGVHPTDKGYELIAKTWYEGIQMALQFGWIWEPIPVDHKGKPTRIQGPDGAEVPLRPVVEDGRIPPQFFMIGTHGQRLLKSQHLILMDSITHSLSYPTTLPLPPTTLLPSSHSVIHRTLNRLTRAALVSLALDWLSDVNQFATAPCLLDSPDHLSHELFPPASSLEHLRTIYNQFKERGGTKREVLDRIIEGDWRHGVSFYALAMADMQYLYSHPSSQKWKAWEILPLSSNSSTSQVSERLLPRFHPSTFLRNMQRECLPDIKIHFNLDRHSSLPLTILRMWILETPYSTSFTLTHDTGNLLDKSRIIYLAFPDFSPYIFISSSNLPSNVPSSPIIRIGNNRSLRKFILEAIPKAYSKPGERYRLRNTSLSTKNLETLVEYRGNGRTNAACGAWALYAETHGKQAVRDNPLEISSNMFPSENDDEVAMNDFDGENKNIRSRKISSRRRRDSDRSDINPLKDCIITNRFGRSVIMYDRKGIERLYIRIEDPFPNISTPIISLNNQADNSTQGKSDLNLEKQKAIRISSVIRKSNAEDSEPAEIEEWLPKISIIFTGSHVFAGIQDLVKFEIIDDTRMPGWMTGEEGISEGVVKNGRITNFDEYSKLP